MALFCPFCSKEISPEAAECKECNATFDSATFKFLENLSKEVSKGFHGELRKQARVPATFKVACSTPKEFLEGYTFDLSLGGVFVKTENPLSLGEIITLQISLPDEAETFEALGEAAWINKKETVTFGKKIPPGMGVKFIKPSKELIDGIINILRQSLTAKEEGAIAFCPSCTKEIVPETTQCPWCGYSFETETLDVLGDIEGIRHEGKRNRREFVRIPHSFEVAYLTAKDLIKSYIFDISQGGVFVKTNTPLNPGEIINLKIHLPDKGKEIGVLGEVIWSNTQERVTRQKKYPPGMGVRFLKLATEDRIRISINILKNHQT